MQRYQMLLESAGYMHVSQLSSIVTGCLRHLDYKEEWLILVHGFEDFHLWSVGIVCRCEPVARWSGLQASGHKWNGIEDKDPLSPSQSLPQSPIFNSTRTYLLVAITS